MVRKCDICGSVIHKTTPKYRVIFDGWLYTERKDICVSCFERIREEIKQADTPQTDCPFKDVPCSCGEQDECEWHTEVDTPQTEECEGCKHYVYQLGCTHHATCEYEPKEPQTDCGWGEPND